MFDDLNFKNPKPAWCCFSSHRPVFIITTSRPPLYFFSAAGAMLGEATETTPNMVARSRSGVALSRPGTTLASAGKNAQRPNQAGAPKPWYRFFGSTGYRDTVHDFSVFVTYRYLPRRIKKKRNTYRSQKNTTGIKHYFSARVRTHGNWVPSWITL